MDWVDPLRHAAAEAIPHIMWTARPDGVFDYYNPRWYQYTGRKTPCEGSTLWQGTLHPEDESQCMQKWEDAKRTGTPYEVEYRFWRGSDQTYRWQSSTVWPVKNENGQIVKWFGIYTDIDEQKPSPQLLQKEVEKRTAQLIAENASLIEKMRQREEARRELAKMVAELTVANIRLWEAIRNQSTNGSV
jgi:PAS domain S-box-containing protein